MTEASDAFAKVFGAARGSDIDRTDTPPPPDVDLDSRALVALRTGAFSQHQMWGYACGVAAGIEHNPTAEQHLSDDGEPFLRYPASAPCLVAVEPDDRLQRTRLGHEVVGTLQALVWDLRSPTDPGPSDETLRLAWELAMGAWELDETVSPPCVWQPAKALYLVDVSPKSGENVVGVPKALLLPVTPALLDCLNLVW